MNDVYFEHAHLYDPMVENDRDSMTHIDFGL